MIGQVKIAGVLKTCMPAMQFFSGDQISNKTEI
jgi:hypothetical protein